MSCVHASVCTCMYVCACMCVRLKCSVHVLVLYYTNSDCFSASHVHILMILRVNHSKLLLSTLFMLCVPDGYSPSIGKQR